MRVLRASFWVLLVLVGSMAAAGLVVSLDHPPSGDARPELTARDAAVLAPRLAALEPSLVRLSDAAQALTAAGREALVSLRALDPVAVAAALDAGKVALRELLPAAEAIRRRLPGLLQGLDGGDRLPLGDRDRVVAMATAAAGVDALSGAWADVAAATVAPMQLIATVRAHDAAVVAATEHGRGERYADALVSLDTAGASLVQAVAVRDDADRAGRDLSTLDGLLLRLSDHDAALRALYRELLASGGVRTSEVEAALAAVTATQRVVADARGALVIAVADVGAGDITPALLIMGRVRGTIDAALPTSAAGDG